MNSELNWLLSLGIEHEMQGVTPMLALSYRTPIDVVHTCEAVELML